jgi:hypothetical protein
VCQNGPKELASFLARKHIPMLKHALFSPDPALYDCFLFPTLKTSLKGTHFQSTEDIHKKMAELLKVI